MFLLLPFVLACATTKALPAPAPVVPPTGAVEAAATATNPFTVAELAAGLPLGTRIRLRFTTPDGKAVEEQWLFLAVDEKGAYILSETLVQAGAPPGARSVAYSSWAELHTHADFPAASTTVEAGTLDTPVGKLDSWLYTVTEGDTVKRLSFLAKQPGPPVLFTQTVAGVETSRMEVLERTVTAGTAIPAFMRAEAVERVKPEFPEGLKSGGVHEGSCGLHLAIDVSGAVTDATVRECDAGTEASTVEAALKWRFKPATLDGVAVASEFDTNFVFKLSP